MIKCQVGTTDFLRAIVQMSLVKSLLSMPVSKAEGAFIIHKDLPWALETRRSQFGFGPITPASHLFVRNNLPTPPASLTDQGDHWSFDVSGCAREGSLTLADLKRMKNQTVATVLQCSGNGRDFFPHDPSGSQWAVGAAGCVLWTGVSVADIFERFGGVKSGLAYLTATGGEELPEGVNQDAVVVERSVPIEKGLRDCLLVWEMNGAPLPVIHGGPVRLIVPGYFGVNNVKWVRRLVATVGESSARIQQSGYRMRAEGLAGGPEHPSMWRMPVKSWLNGHGADGAPVLAGLNTLYGVAFSGERGVEAVEVSAEPTPERKKWYRTFFAKLRALQEQVDESSFEPEIKAMALLTKTCLDEIKRLNRNTGEFQWDEEAVKEVGTTVVALTAAARE